MSFCVEAVPEAAHSIYFFVGGRNLAKKLVPSLELILKIFLHLHVWAEGKRMGTLRWGVIDLDIIADEICIMCFLRVLRPFGLGPRCHVP